MDALSTLQTHKEEKMGFIGSLFGGSSKAEKQALAQQQATLDAQKAEATTQLEERQNRMKKAQTGRASLLSGTEMGTQTPLATTLG